MTLPDPHVIADRLRDLSEFAKDPWIWISELANAIEDYRLHDKSGEYLIIDWPMKKDKHK
jgi:hypothetical protein